MKSCYLKLTKNGQIIDTIKVEKEVFVIGREIGDLIVDDYEISSSHCQIHIIDGNFHLFDMNSTNGTFLNGNRIVKAKISSGDYLKVGQTVFVFVIADMVECFNFDTLTIDNLPEPILPDLIELDSALEQEYLNIKNTFNISLRVSYGKGSSEELVFTEGEAILGRQNTFGRFAEDKELSRKHCRFYIDTFGFLRVEDLESMNGVFVNEEKIKFKRLTASDSVTIGKCEIKATIVKYGS